MLEYTIPAGTKDVIKQDCKNRRWLQTKLMKVFTSWGYEEVITPMVEYYQTFSIAQMKEQELYKILDASNRILTLRADMTIPIARVAATKCKEDPLPLRFQYCANVFKVNESLRGNQNESSDCGIELLGVEEPYGDLEVLACALDALSLIKEQTYTLEIGNLNFFQAACDQLRLSEEVRTTLADLINRKSLKSLQDYVETLSLCEDKKNFFLQLPWLCGDLSVLEEARKVAFHEDLIQILDQLQLLCEQLYELGYQEKITIDLGKIPKLKYYTGLIFEAFVEGIGISVLSGGRYDKLGKRFGHDVAAIGFAIRLDALSSILTAPQEMPIIQVEYPPHALVPALQLAKTYRDKAIVQLCLNKELKEISIKEGGTKTC